MNNQFTNKEMILKHLKYSIWLMRRIWIKSIPSYLFSPIRLAKKSKFDSILFGNIVRTQSFDTVSLHVCWRTCWRTNQMSRWLESCGPTDWCWVLNPCLLVKPRPRESRRGKHILCVRYMFWKYRWNTTKGNEESNANNF